MGVYWSLGDTEGCDDYIVSMYDGRKHRRDRSFASQPLRDVFHIHNDVAIQEGELRAFEQSGDKEGGLTADVVITGMGLQSQYRQAQGDRHH